MIFHSMKKLYKILFFVGVGGGGNFPGGQFSWGEVISRGNFLGALFPGAFYRGAFFLAPMNDYQFFDAQKIVKLEEIVIY